MAKAKKIVTNMAHILHAQIDVMAMTHIIGILHTNLHPFNIVMDFIKDLVPQVNIID